MKSEKEVKMKRTLIVCLVGLLVIPGFLLGFTSQANAEDYPSKDIRLIIGGKPGGGFDTYSRAIGRYMKKYLPEGVNLITENRPGAGHKIAITMVYNAEPDGYTIGMPMMPGLYFPQMFEEQKYDMTKVTWLVTILKDPRVLAIAPNSKFKTLKDLQQADSVRVPIVGFSSETGVILANEKLGINAKYISGHKNSKEAVLAALRGDGDAVGFTFGSLRKFFVQKQLIPVAVMGSEKRIPAISDVPTLAELGHADLNEMLGTYRVLAGPPNLPADRAKYLRDTIWKTLNDKEFVAWSKQAKRPVEALDGEATAKALEPVMKGYTKYKDILEKYVK
jgi:tripartite-type tricarboxylate transporter receptor subunit TctC